MQFQANIPFKLTHKFINALGYKPSNQDVLVIRDFFTALLLAANNRVTFVTDDVEARDLFENKVITNPIYGSDDNLIFVDSENDKNAWKNFIEEVKTMPKFDVAIMNPPYNKNLHLKILEQVINIATDVVNISPCTWAAKHNVNQPKGKYRNIFNGRIKSFQFIPHREMNDMFGLGNAIEDGSIIVFSTQGKFDILNYGFKSDVEKSLFSKIKTVGNDKLLSLPQAGIGIKKIEITNASVALYSWHSSDNCYDAVIKKEHKSVEYGITFSTINEKINFENSLKTTFMNWYHKNFIVPGDNKVVAYMFVMKDYTQPWDDKRFCNFFGITGFISDTEAEPGSEWEEILNAMKM